MKFERGNSVTETLKIGRVSNAFSIDHIEVLAKIEIAVIPELITNDLAAKYDLISKDYVSLGLSFFMKEQALIFALDILEKDGICKRFDSYIKNLIMMRSADCIQNYKFLPLDLTREIVPILIHALLCKKPNYESIYFDKKLLSFNLVGEDLFYQNKLYRIAEPVDGGLEDVL